MNDFHTRSNRQFTLRGRLRSTVLLCSIATMLCVAVLVAVRAASASQQPDVGPASRSAVHSRVAVPAGIYRSLIVSPAPIAGDPNNPAGTPARFTLRTYSAKGTVDDYVFHVPTGETLTIPFPSALSLNTDALLFAPAHVRFAAWGQTDGGLVRAEDVTTDVLEDQRARERAREFDLFLRERERNRLR